MTQLRLLHRSYQCHLETQFFQEFPVFLEVQQDLEDQEDVASVNSMPVSSDSPPGQNSAKPPVRVRERENTSLGEKVPWGPFVLGVTPPSIFIGPAPHI